MFQKLFFLTLLLSLSISCNETTTNQNQPTAAIDNGATVNTDNRPAPSTPTPTSTASNIAQKYVNYIPEGYYAVVSEDTQKNVLVGDFNLDEKDDFALLMINEKKKAEEDYSEEADVRLVIFEQNEKGDFIEKSRSGNISTEYIFNQYTNQLELGNKNVISLRHQGMRFDYELKFRYQEKQDNYMVIGAEYNSYGNAAHDGAGNISSNFLSGKRVAIFNEYDYDKEELKELPAEKTNLPKELMPLDDIDAKSVYKCLGV